MRIVVTGGGTGGHIFPALAVADLLRQQGHDILYIGKPESMESELAPARGFAFEGVPFMGMPRKPGLALLIAFIQWLALLWRAQQKAKMLLQSFQPDIVFGTGGYVSAPVLMAASGLKIPYAIHEPDAQPGLVNRFMARQASLVTAAFSDSRAKMTLRKPGALFEVTGNPVRADLGSLNQQEALESFAPDWSAAKTTLLVFGGSQGARKINQALIDSLPVLLDQLHLQVIHLSGQKLFEETQALWQGRQGDVTHASAYRLLAFSNDMPTLMAASDLAVCRSGSLTLSETYLAKLPSILVPYPYAAGDHQSMNALASASAGASVVMTDADCSGGNLAERLDSLLKDPDKLAGMRAAASGLARPEASRRIGELLLCLPQFPR